jgi:hypothetical protein
VAGNRGAVGGYQAEYGAADETENAGGDGGQKRLSQWLLQSCKACKV